MKTKKLIKVVYSTAAMASCVLLLFELNLQPLKMLTVGSVFQLLPGIILFSFSPLILVRVLVNTESVEEFRSFRKIHKKYKKNNALNRNMRKKHIVINQ